MSDERFLNDILRVHIRSVIEEPPCVINESRIFLIKNFLQHFSFSLLSFII